MNHTHHRSIAKPPRFAQDHAMHVNRSDLADFTYFLAIARHRSFRRAGLELGSAPRRSATRSKGWRRGLACACSTAPTAA
jgi:hypothetical protein